jgi:hypothetical protein
VLFYHKKSLKARNFPIKPGGNFHNLSPNGVRKTQLFRTQKLGGNAQFPGYFHGLFVSVLGVTQNGKTHMAAMYPQLVGASGDGIQF